MRIQIAAGLLIIVAACAEDAPTVIDQTTGEDEAEFHNYITEIVREFADDPRADVTIDSFDGLTACGTVSTRGKMRDFYADVEDEEAFIESGIEEFDRVIKMAC